MHIFMMGSLRLCWPLLTVDSPCGHGAVASGMCKNFDLTLVFQAVSGDKPQ